MNRHSLAISIIVSAIFMILGGCGHDKATMISERFSEVGAMLSAGQKDAALANLLELENNLDESIPDTLRYDILSRTGAVYYDNLKKDKADEYFKKALSLARKCDDGRLSGALWNRCLTITDNDSIFILLSECQAISHDCGLKYTEAMAGINIANAYAQSGRPDEARETLENLDTVVGDDEGLIIELNNARLGLLMRGKQYDEALEILDAQNPADLNLNGKLSRYGNYYTIEVGNERYAKALDYRDSIDAVKNSLDSISHDERLAQVEFEFSSRLAKEREQRNTAIIVGTCVALLLSALIFHGVRRRRIMRRQLELTEQIHRLNLKIANLTKSHEENPVASAVDESDIQDEVIEKLRLNRELFINLPVHGRLRQLNLKRDVGQIDKTEAKEVLDGVIGQFADVCTNIRQLFPTMTYDDVLYCAAIYAGFSKEVASVAFGSSEEALRRRKSRIKQKLSTALFEAIFVTKT